MLRLEKINKRWGKFAHRDIDLALECGEFFVLLGPSGAGKSLLLELIAGFARPDSGRIDINGADVTALPPEKRNIGFVYQDLMLFPHKTVRENVGYGPTARGLGKGVVAERVAKLAETLRLTALLDRPAEALSIGQKQRVALARALAVEPDILLLDEPFSSLDPPLKRRLWGELKRVHRETGVTVLQVTHDRAEALHLGDRIGVIRDGRIRQVGTHLDIFEKPNSGFVAEFTGATNIYNGVARAKGGLREFAAGGAGGLRLVTTSTLSGACRAVVRPENIIISQKPVRTSARNCLEGVVEKVARRGEMYEVTGRFGEHLMTCVVTPLSIEELEIGPGVPVYFSFKAGSVHLFRDGNPTEQESDDIT